jgi:hypothetical protein
VVFSKYDWVLLHGAHGGPFIAHRDLEAVVASFIISQPSLSAGAPNCPVAHRTLHSTTDLQLATFHFRRAPDCPVGGTRQSDEPSDHWMQLMWQIVVGCLHNGLSGAPRGPSGEL